jgi:hypothetical protein
MTLVPFNSLRGSRSALISLIPWLFSFGNRLALFPFESSLRLKGVNKMKSFRIAGIAVLVLAGAALSYGQRGSHGPGGGAPPSGMGGEPPSGLSTGTGHSNPNIPDHGSASTGQPTSPTQSQKRSPEQLLDQNSKLTDNLQKLLPAGTTPQQACSGFKNLGSCVAAIHVSHNLGISFSDLQSKLTGSNSESLGKAIHELKPDVDANAEKKKAEHQAKDDMNGSKS